MSTTSSSQRPCKKISPLGLGILAVAGCGLGYQQTPYPPCFLPDDPDPACQSGQGAEGSGTAATCRPPGQRSLAAKAGAAARTRTGGPGSDSGADSGEIDTGTTTGASGGESTGPVVQPEPEILDMVLKPDAPKSAGPVEVTVQAENAVEVWMTVDSGRRSPSSPSATRGPSSSGRSPCSASPGTGYTPSRRSPARASWRARRGRRCSP
jgi:hypothetical protein